MTTAEHDGVRDATRQTREYSVRLQLLVAAPELSSDALERLAIDVLEAVERNSSEALGAAVACDFAAGAVDLQFSLEVKSASEVHHRVGLLLSAIERDTNVIIEFTSETAPLPLPA